MLRNSTHTDFSKTNIITVQLEDYFQVGAFEGLIEQNQWYRFEDRVHRNVRRTLDLLKLHEIRATFFVSGWIADRYPEIVRTLAEEGHEIASKGYDNLRIGQMTPGQFRDDLARSREAIERARGTSVLGYRVSRGWLQTGDLWALDVLAEEGYAYDSSICPRFRNYTHQPWRRLVHEHVKGDRKIWEVPVSSRHLFGFDLPIAGGNYIRQFPHTIMSREVEKWIKSHELPFVMYFHVWELDPEQPKIQSVSFLTRMRHYRNLGKLNWILEDYFQRYRFASIAEFLKLDARADRHGNLSSPLALSPKRELVEASGGGVAACSSTGRGDPVTVVIPCYNEEVSLPYLANTLKNLRAELGRHFDLRFIFVDDGSADTTWDSLNMIFGTWPGITLLKHDANRGVSAAIRTGIDQAETEIVCSMDCDCTYDPHELASMIPLLTPGIDMVTASPYHPQGSVRNVPAWRLMLSRGASFLYRRVLEQKLYTYTSCFRVYRRSAVLGLSISRPGFLGVAELVGELDFKGSRIVEHPTVLSVRVFGCSKMKTLRTILGHIGLLKELLGKRLARRLRQRKPKVFRQSNPHQQAMIVDQTIIGRIIS